MFNWPKLITRTVVFTVGVGLLAGSGNAALADDYSQGMSYFQAKDYKNAAASLKKAIFDRPGDANTFYYYALALHYAKDYAGAKVAYLEIITRYPSSDAATRAQQALNTLSPGLLASAGAGSKQSSHSGATRSAGGSNTVYTSGSASSASSAGTSGDIIPSSSVVNGNMENGHLVVDVAFNGRRTRAIFDTGAEMILMGKNHMREIGLQPPTGETIARSRGVGGKIEDVWGQRMDVTVGGVTRKNILVHIQEQMDSLPLLGLPFVQGINYSVDGSSIHLTAKGSGGSSVRANDFRAVPYVMQGRSMIVQVQINGRPVNMCFDTGANGTVFTRSQAAAAGISVDENGEVMIGSGVGGASAGRYTTVGSMRLGPVDKRDMKVAVDFTSQLNNPLLGKDFWGDHRFTVDQDSHCIRFE